MTEAARRAETGTRAPAAAAPPPQLMVRRLTVADLTAALRAGLSDMRRAPGLALFFGALYAVGGWLIMALLWVIEMPYLAYPLAMGFALVAPFVVTGLYDVSRRLERGEPLTFAAVLGSVWETRRRDLRWMAAVTVFALVIWLDIAAALFLGVMGLRKLDAALLVELLTTPKGLALLLVGHAVGAIIAFMVFSISVVSFPLLFDRDIDFVTAMMTSVRVVRESPCAMMLWCGSIAALVVVSLATAFIALLFVLPLLGHASWHLYRRAVA